MTAAITVTIMCDAPSCGEWDDDGQGPTAKAARAGLTGWATALAPPGKGPALDYCPRHHPQRHTLGAPTHHPRATQR